MTRSRRLARCRTREARGARSVCAPSSMSNSAMKLTCTPPILRVRLGTRDAVHELAEGPAEVLEAQEDGRADEVQ